MLIFFIWHIVPLFAFFHTFRCFAAFTFAWTTSTVHMMLAWLDFVRTTTLIRSIWTAGDNTFANPIAPRSAGKTTTQNTNSNHYFSAPGIKREQVEKKNTISITHCNRNRMCGNTIPNHRPKYGRFLYHCCECKSARKA